MNFSGLNLSHCRKMVVIAGYQKGEDYGLLGPQMAATIIEAHTPCKCIVLGVSREDDTRVLKRALASYFGRQKPVIGFTALSGRPDLFDLAGELKASGAVTILAGPQAAVDFSGETDCASHPHRFQGLAVCFSAALQGPAEQILPLFDFAAGKDIHRTPGLVYRDSEDRRVRNPAASWDERYLAKVGWHNLYTAAEGGLAPLPVRTGQVLQQIGCPHAARLRSVDIDHPAALADRKAKKVRIEARGCSFCDVAADKGYHGRLGIETVISQVRCLPQGSDGRKIPFELINENPLPGLADLLLVLRRREIHCSQINLTLRADWLSGGGEALQSALAVARESGTIILLSSIGFESFDDTILRNLNKGLTVEKNLEAVRLIRRLKDEFPDAFGYSSGEGAVHGFIHPTPWDTLKTEANIQKTIHLCGLQNDILPRHSTPLIIHHASALGDWIREIETRENLAYRRHGTIVAWWESPLPR